MSARRGAFLLAGALIAAAAAAGTGFLFSASAARAATGSSKPQRLLIEKDAAYARQAAGLAQGGLRVVADYGAFVLAEVPAGSPRSRLAAAGVRVRRERPEGVRLRRRLVTALPRAPAATADGRDDLHLIRFSGPPRRSWVQSLAELPGARVLMTLPEDAYIVWLPERAREALASLDARWSS